MSEDLPKINLLNSPNWRDYSLLDSGNGRKFEKYGPYKLVRPEPEAIWKPGLPEKEWLNADSEFVPSAEKNGGHWESKERMEDRWKMEYNGLKFWVQTTASRHLGVFPEQATQWDWIESQISEQNRPLNVLNLFGYTGMASLAAARAGANVTHVDASHKVIRWGKENQLLSSLEDRPVRWLVDDAFKFVKREVRRGNVYDGIILDPPKFGRGPKGEIWEFYKILPDLLEGCRQILSSQPQFLLLTAYAVKASALTLHFAIEETMRKIRGYTSVGEVVLQEINCRHAISKAIYARWTAKTH
jgi:23S rRNA (cytosine1962-C5)-methyltransferase